MLLIYIKSTSYRLQYICQFIFKEQLGLAYSLTLDAQGFATHDGPKINYSDDSFEDAGFTIKNAALLFEQSIQQQPVECFEVNDHKAFFKSDNSDFPFDIFAASFYLLSRYEEYLPYEKDMYGRYAHENAVAFKEGFLNKPIVNIWVGEFAKALVARFPTLSIQKNTFKFIPTYDIDIAYSYKNKGLLRNLGGFIKKPSFDRISVLLRAKKDPFDSYQFFDELHKANQLKPIYFFLVATMASEYDKNISPYAYAMWQLIKQHAKKYVIGVHPSWRSFTKSELIKKEKKIIETAGNIDVYSSRQHYIKMALPDTYEHLIAAGITNDFSMGYGSINGFRASVASSFTWYNLKTDKITSLRIHPFCFMEANSFYEQQQNADQAYDELMYYYNQCKNIDGQLITIFHNDSVGTDHKFAGWRAMYQKFIAQLPQ